MPNCGRILIAPVQPGNFHSRLTGCEWRLGATNGNMRG
jgi:hypothetical protein